MGKYGDNSDKEKNKEIPAMLKMEKFKKISVTGDLGSGKSTVSKILKSKLNYDYYSTGDIQRKIAAKHNITTLELNKLSELNTKIDNEIDNFTIELAESKKQIIVDSRLAWHFIPNSFKIYLTVNLQIASKRVVSDSKRKSESYKLITEAKKDLIKRKESENKRFKRLYKVNCSDLSNYDLVINTSLPDAESIADIIGFNFKKWSLGIEITKYWYPSKLLFPLQPRAVSTIISDSIQENGYDYNSIINTVQYKDWIFIYDGHKRVSGAISANISLIPIYIIPEMSVEKFINTSSKLSLICDWEDYHKFRYIDYPKFK